MILSQLVSDKCYHNVACSVQKMNSNFKYLLSLLHDTTFRLGLKWVFGM
jgi:hypothetical protein